MRGRWTWHKSMLSIWIGVWIFQVWINIPAMAETSFELSNYITKTQDGWIKAHNSEPILIGINEDSRSVYLDANGDYQGFLYDFLYELSQNTGMKFEYKIGPIDELTYEFNIGGLSGIVGNPGVLDLKDDIIYTKELDRRKYWLYGNEVFQDLSDIEGKSIGFYGGTGGYKFVKDQYDVDIVPMVYYNYEALFHDLENNIIDGFLLQDCLYSNNLINQQGIVRNFQVADLPDEINIIFDSRYEVLKEILDDTIINNDLLLQQLKAANYIDYLMEAWNPEEEVLASLHRLENIKVGYMKDYIPYDYHKNDEDLGISSVFVEDLVALVGINVQYIGYDNYQFMLSDLANNKIQLVTSGSLADTDNDDLLATLPYSKSFIAVAGNKDQKLGILSLLELTGAKVALIQGSWQEKLLIENKISFQPVYVASIHEGLEMLDVGEADYIFDTYYALNYIINESRYNNIRISSQLLLENSKCFLTNTENEALLSAINIVIDYSNLYEVEREGLHMKYALNPFYGFFEVLTVMLFLLLGLVVVYVTILIRRLNEEREKALNANKSKSEFLAKMSHEIRTPLTAIMGYINLLNKSTQIPEKEKEQLKIAGNSSSILIHLVNDILDFSAIEAGKVQMAKEPFNLRLMINNVVNIIGIMAEEKNLEFIVKLPPELPVHIVGDERRLEQVLINILSNGVKFTKEGSISLRATSEYLGDKVRLNFTVTDTGKGMNLLDVDKLFEAFEQEDNTISREYGGSGLGLYIARGFIIRMGGDIRVASDLGEGTSFEFYTLHDVAVETETANYKKELYSITSLIGKRVLLVEDNEINQMIIRDMLSELGLKVIIVDNGQEAVDIANRMFHFILMDIQMPIMSGIEAVKIMKMDKGLTDVPIIALTANVLPEQINSYKIAGFDAYCSKPILTDELTQTLLEIYTDFYGDNEVT